MDARSLQSVGQPTNVPPRVATLNERLNRALDRIESEADRIEQCLGRINGTPNKGGVVGSSQVATMRNMVSVVDGLEQQAERLRALAEHVDQVA